MKKIQSGFTLIELLVVIAIVGILAAVALPAYKTYADKAKFTEVVAGTSGAKMAVEVCYATTGSIGDCDLLAEVGITSEQYGELNKIFLAPDSTDGFIITATADSLEDSAGAAATYVLTGTISTSGTGRINWDGVCDPLALCQ